MWIYNWRVDESHKPDKSQPSNNCPSSLVDILALVQDTSIIPRYLLFLQNCITLESPILMYVVESKHIKLEALMDISTCLPTFLMESAYCMAI